MDITVLTTSQKLTKKYEIDSKSTPNGPKKYLKTPYPFAYEFSSCQYAVKQIQDLTKLTKVAAKNGGCLLKGTLLRPLNCESRQDSTDPMAPTEWICLDFDGIDGYQSIDQLLDTLGCGDTSYVLQWSSSMGIENKAGFRCHVFMLLDKPTSPHTLKNWLQDLNLKHLSTQLDLTKTGNSLRWPLDITTCQNDKLIYVAPPILGPGIKDPFPKGDRITLVPRTNERLILPNWIPSREVLRETIAKEIHRLREQKGLPKRRSIKYKYAGTVEYMQNPDSATVSEIKAERGFVYLNLNGGDSWAYYHPENNPDFIYNFKGEPTYRTEDLLPDYWATLQHKTRTPQPNAEGLLYLAFRDFRTSNYYNGIYDMNTGKLKLAMAKNESQLRQFMEQHGQYLSKCVPDWNLTWDPHNPNVIDTDKHELNTYQPSTYFQIANPPVVTTVPPTINKIISHVLRNDAVTIDTFLNWLACIVQFKTRTGTAWVWQGAQGTGKGVLFHQILTPLFSEANVVSKRMEELDSEFTGFMENKFVVFVDEIESGKSLYHNKVTAKLKNLIVEPTISIRKMYAQAFMAPNHANMIFASNKAASVEVAPDDRRFNVGPYQETPIQLTATEVDSNIPAELEDFYAFLMHYPADQNRARTPLISAARNTLIDISRTAVDTVSDALLNGNLEFFWAHLSTAKVNAMNPLQTFKYTPFRELIINLVNTQETKLSRDELFTIMEWCVGNMPPSPNKFTSLLKHHRIHLIQIWKNNRNVRGINVDWKTDPAWLAQAQQEISNGDV